MSKKLKKLIISLVVVLIVGVGGFFIWNTISNMSDIVISDFKLLDSNDKAMQNTEVFLGEASTNGFAIKVGISANGQNGGYTVYSTDRSVADVKPTSDGYYVEYFSAGEVMIVAQSNMAPNVNDKFKLTVRENVAVDLNFEETLHAKDKTINVYADDEEYRYKYNLIGFDDGVNANASSIRVAQTYDTDLFKKIEVDVNTNELVVVVNSTVGSDVVGSQMDYITLQSFAQDSTGNDVVVKNFIIKTNIVGNVIEDVQLVLSHTPDFSDGVYVHSYKHSQDGHGTEFIYDGETLIDEIHLNSRVNSIYMKVRFVFTNHHTMDVTSFVEAAPSDQARFVEFNYDNNKTILLFMITDTATAAAIQEINVHLPPENELGLILDDGSTRRFTINYLGNGDLSIEDLYSTHTENGVTYYTYTYFDPRFKRTDAIVDSSNRIIGFSNNA
ncbi:MAG: hypothetical protein IJW24_00450 [Clostridia bacterium]|nr:hypothetical protein [Clostridia bacterium]